MIEKVNVLIIGNGHYATGTTVLTDVKATDKDFGVILPSILELKKQGLINRIYLAAKNGHKFKTLRKKLDLLNQKFGWDADIEFFPNDDEIDNRAYIDVLKSLPKPGVVLIATPTNLHYNMIMETIKNGHHFLVVKPIVTKLSDLEDIIIQQRKNHVLGFVDYHKVYDEANLILKEQYKQNNYGEIQHIFSKMTQRRDMLEIFSDWISKETNVNHYLGSHYIHIVGFITGANPLNVRSTCQYGLVKEDYGYDTPDLFETQIVWEKNGKKFTSYHIAGWTDPSETSAMTYQEIHIIGTNGQIKSDQRFRGFETVLKGHGEEILNPYFFYLNKGLDGAVNLEGKYGFKSIKTFIKSAIEVENGTDIDSFEGIFPTIKDSRIVTAILEAADKSIKNNNSVIDLKDFQMIIDN